MSEQQPKKKLKLMVKADFFRGPLRDPPSITPPPSDEITIMSSSAPSSPSSTAASVITSISSSDPSSPASSAAPTLTNKEQNLIKTWHSSHTWLLHNDIGMYCTVCTRINIGKETFTSANPCKTITKQSVTRHDETERHLHALKLSIVPAAIDVIDEKQVSNNTMALRHKTRMVHFLASQEIANVKFEALQAMAKAMGVQGLNLESSGNYDYSDSTFVRDVISAMAKHIRDQLLAEIATVPFLAVLMDETTDVSTTKQLCIYVRYVFKVDVKTSFIGLVELPHGDAQAIVNALSDFFGLLAIPKNKVIAIGSDGASTFTGIHGGVCKIMKDTWNPMITSYHCMAHKLNLASADAVASTPLIGQHLEVIGDIKNYFSMSPSRKDAFEAIQAGLKIKIRQLIRPATTRWLSHDMAVDAVHYLYPALILYFSKERTATPKAELIWQSIFSTQFIHLNMLLNELLHALSILSQMLQEKNIDIQSAQQALDTSVKQINDIQDKTDRYKDVNDFIKDMYTRYPSLPTGLTLIDMTTHISWQRQHGTPFIHQIRENIATRFPKDRLLSSFTKVFTSTHTHTLTHILSCIRQLTHTHSHTSCLVYVNSHTHTHTHTHTQNVDIIRHVHVSFFRCFFLVPILSTLLLICMPRLTCPSFMHGTPVVSFPSLPPRSLTLPSCPIRCFISSNISCRPRMMRM